jgi:hypothetical protein
MICKDLSKYSNVLSIQITILLRMSKDDVLKLTFRSIVDQEEEQD